MQLIRFTVWYTDRWGNDKTLEVFSTTDYGAIQEAKRKLAMFGYGCESDFEAERF